MYKKLVNILEKISREKKKIEKIFGVC